MAVTLLIATVPALASAQPQPRIYNDELRAIFAAPEATLRERRRSPMAFESGRVVWTCADFLEEAGRSRLDDTIGNDRERREYTICDTLELLAKADWTPPPRDEVGSYGRAMLERLDFRSFGSSVGPRVTDRHYLPIQHWGEAAKTSKYVLDFEDAYLLYKLEVVAEGDVDGDGRADLIVWLSDVVKHGTYSEFRVLTISGPTETGLLRAVQMER